MLDSGGLGIRNPVSAADDEFRASVQITKSLSNLIESQSPTLPYEVLEDQITAKAAVKTNRRADLKTKAVDVRDSLPPSLQLANGVAA